MGKKQEYKLRGEEYLRELSQKEGIRKLPNGILYEVIKEESGKGRVTKRSIVTCHYRDSPISGDVFDDSWQRGTPEAFRVNELIIRFQTALCAMYKGDRWRVHTPYQEGYGSKRDDDTPASSALISKIELFSIGQVVEVFLCLQSVLEFNIHPRRVAMRQLA